LKSRYKKKLVVIGLVLSFVVVSSGCSWIGKKAVEETTGVSVDKDNESVKVKTKEGEAEIQAGENKLPDGFPEDFPIYEDAKITSSSKISTEQGTSFTVQLETDDDKSTVADYYKNALPDSGYKVQATAETPEGVMYSLEKSGMVQVVVVEGKTTVQITLVK